MNNYVSKFGPGDKVIKPDGTTGIVQGFWVLTVLYRLDNDQKAYHDGQLKAAK